MKSISGVVHSSILVDFNRLARTLGLDPIELADCAGVDRKYLENTELPVPASAVAGLLETAALSSGVADFGLRLGESRGLPDLGPVILMLREEATVRDALRRLIAMLHLHSDVTYIHLEEEGTPILTISVLAGNANSCWQLMDSSVAALTHILRWLISDDWAPKSAGFTHSRPRSKTRYERFFRCPVDFRQEFNGIVLRSEDLDRRLRASSPALRRQAERYIRGINVAPSDSYVYRVRQVVAMALPRGEAKAELIASYLGTNRRTLHERLARAGLNYCAVVAGVRKGLVAQYMLGSDRMLSEIAGLLGFGSLSAFTQWFRRSFDRTPSGWRKSRLSQRGP